MSVVNKSILAQIEEARKELLDLSLRNPLLNYRPLRARGLEVVGVKCGAGVRCTGVRGETDVLSGQAVQQNIG